MSRADKFIDLFIGTVVRLFILLTFLVAVVAVCGLLERCWYSNEPMGWGEILLMAVLLVANSLIAWHAGKWLVSEPQKASEANLLVIWLVLIFTCLWLFVMALSGLGSSQ